MLRISVYYKSRDFKTFRFSKWSFSWLRIVLFQKSYLNVLPFAYLIFTNEKRYIFIIGSKIDWKLAKYVKKMFETTVPIIRSIIRVYVKFQRISVIILSNRRIVGTALAGFYDVYAYCAAYNNSEYRRGFRFFFKNIVDGLTFNHFSYARFIRKREIRYYCNIYAYI